MLAELVKELRLKSGKSSKQLSLEANRNETWVSQIERGKIKNPHLPSLKILLRSLGVAQEKVEDIILDQVETFDNRKYVYTRYKYDYLKEKKAILTRRGKGEESNEVVTVSKEYLTRKDIIEICRADANRIIQQVKELPKETIELVVTGLMEEI